MAGFGSGHSRTPRPTVENTPRVPQPPSRGVARESITVVIDGREQILEIVRHERIHGQEAFWVCRCGALRWHLYVVSGEIACRVCHRLTYRSKQAKRPAVTRAARLRRRLGALPNLLAPVPPKPKHWPRVHYAHLVAELAAAESVIAGMLRATVAAVKRRRRSFDRHGN